MSRAKDPDDLRQLQIIRVFVHHDNSSVYDGNKQGKSVSFPCIKMSGNEDGIYGQIPKISILPVIPPCALIGQAMRSTAFCSSCLKIEEIPLLPVRSLVVHPGGCCQFLFDLPDHGLRTCDLNLCTLAHQPEFGSFGIVPYLDLDVAVFSDHVV